MSESSFQSSQSQNEPPPRKPCGKRAAANSLRFPFAPEADQSHCLSTTQLAYS